MCSATFPGGHWKENPPDARPRAANVRTYNLHIYIHVRQQGCQHLFPIIGRGRFIYFKKMIGLGVLQDRARLLVWMTLCYRVTNIAYRLALSL